MTAQAKELGPYRVLSVLGRGGMATVYKGQDTRDGRLAAVKVMSSAYTERKDMALRFRREFRAIKRLAHPNIVQVLDYGEAEGSFYFAMEFVDGVDLAKYFGLRVAGKSVRPDVLKAPGRVRKVLEVTSQICDALLYIHSERIVHRDMKPSNVFVTKDGTVKLMDFGIAKELDQTAALTRHGSFLGTAYYTAPEQIRGARDLDGRADLYALGVMLYEAFAGRLPFYSDNTVDVLRMHILEPPLPIPNLNPLVPSGVSDVVLQLLAKDPQERYQDAGELKEAIEALPEFPRDRVAQRPSRAEPKRRPLLASGLIGRRKELAKLVDAMDAATVGQPVFASVMGPLGVGKTRLLRALEEQVHGADGLFLLGSYHADRAGPYLGWREVFSASITYLMGYGIPFAREVAGSSGRILRRIAPAFGRIDPDQSLPARLEPQEERLRLFEAALTYVRSLAAHAPVVIALDNFQWAFDADYELISFLMRGLVSPEGDADGATGSPDAKCDVMLVVAYRDDEIPADHPLRSLTVARPDNLRFVEVRVRPFEKGEVRDFVVAMAGGGDALGGNEAVDRLVGHIMRETGGNPYHAEEMAKAVVVPIREGRSDAATLDSSVAALPSTPPQTGGRPLTSAETTKRNVGDLLLSRMRALSEDARNVLRAAAVIAEGIEFEPLGRLSNIDEDLLLDVVDELIRDRFLVERDRGDLFDFHQSLVRDAVYGSIPDETRRNLHGRMAELLADRARTNPEGFAAQHALHCERAGNQKRAAVSYIKAGDAALHGNRVDEAERYYERARQLGGLVPTHTAESSTDELDLEVRRGSLLMARGEANQAAEVYESVMARAKQKSDHRRAGDVARRLGNAYARAGNHVLAVANLEWALNLARKQGDQELEAAARDGLGAAHLVRGRFDKALEQVRAALALRKVLKDRVGATRALAGAAQALAAKGDLQAALRMQRDALTFSQRLQETAGAARGNAELAELYRVLGESDLCRRHQKEALRLAHKAGDHEVEVAVLTTGAMARVTAVELVEARKLSDRAIQMARSLAEPRLLSRALVASGDEALMRHDLTAAKGRYEEAREVSNQLGDRVVRGVTARALARVALKVRALDSARAYLEEARATHEKVGAALELAEDVVASGAVAVATAVAETSSGTSPRSERGRSLLSGAREDIASFLPSLEQGKARPLHAYALLVQAEIALALREEEAVELAAQAYDLAVQAEARDLCLRARLVGGRARFFVRDWPAATRLYQDALDILRANAGRIADKSERRSYLSEPDRRSLVDEVKTLASRSDRG